MRRNLILSVLLMVLVVSAALPLTFADGPIIALDPTHGIPGTSVTVTGSGFNPADVIVFITGTPVVDAPVSCSVNSPAGVINPGCTFLVAYILPWFATYQVNATGNYGDVASADFIVDMPPTAFLDPDHGPVGTNVTISGSGFDVSDTSVSITGTPVADAPVICAYEYFFSCNFTVADVSPGTYQVNATGDSIGDIATVYFQVEALPQYPLTVYVYDTNYAPIQNFPVYLNGTEALTNSTGGVTWLVAAGTYNVTVPQTYEPNATARHVFLQWLDDGQPTDPVRMLTISEPTDLSASYQNYYYLATSVSPSGSGGITLLPIRLDYFFLQGSPVTATAAPAENFAHWMFDGHPAGSTNPLVFTMNMTHTLEADFQPSGNCPDGYDTQTFTTPTIIDTPTTWTCVHYSVINVTVTDTGSLTINNSTIDQSPYATAGAGIRNYGPLTYNFSTILIDTDTPQSAFETHHSYMSSVEVRGYAHAEIYDSTSAGFGIAPTVHVTINNFNAELMTGTYDFTTQWGMTTPYVYVQNFTAPVTLNLVDGVTATISSSTFSIVGVINAGTNIVDSNINTLVMTEESTVTIDPSTIQYLILFDQASDTLTINNFNETNNDGGNFNFDTWGFSQLHVTTVSSTVLHVALFMMQGGHISVTHSTLSQVHTTNGALGTVQGSEIGILEASNAAAVNATGSTFQIVACEYSGTARVTNSTSFAIISDNGSLIQLLNVTDTIEQASNGGSIQKSWYAFVNVYDSVTHLPLNGVSLSVEDTFGNSQTESIDGSARFILREYDLLSDLSHEWSVDYYPYDLTASKLGYQTAAASIAHFSNPTINLYLIPSVPCTGGVCEVTFHTNPTMIGSITITGHGTYHNGEIATLPPDTYSITADIPTGYSFLAWTTSGVFVSPSTTATATMTVNSNGDVTANYHATTCNPCRVTFFSTPTPYGTVSVAGHGTYTNGQYVDLPPGIYTVTATPPYSVPPTPSWAFLSWSIAGGVGITGGSTATLTVTGTGDGAVTAIFQQLSTHATISVNTSPSGLDTPTGSGTYAISDVATVSVSNVPGYTFQKWQRDGTDYTTQQTFLYVVDANHTFTAVFQPIQSGQYTITVNTNPSGLDSPHGGGTYALGAVAHIGVSDVANYTFQKWLRDGADYSTLHSFNYTVDATHTFTAMFQSIVTPPSSGMVISLGSAHLTLQAGSTAQFTVVVSSTQPTQVTLTISNLPSGWQYAFTPTTGTTNPQFTSTLTVTTSSTATAEDYSITVTARDSNGKTVTEHFIVEVTAPPTTTPPPPTNPSRTCIIATAAYGSPMNPEVAYMRYVRDDMIGSTPTGRVLRDAWNTFYYSWSPPIAGDIASSSILQAVFRTLLLPLVGIIHMTAFVFTALGSGDFASVVAFTVAAVLSITGYILVPAFALRRILKRV